MKIFSKRLKKRKDTGDGQLIQATPASFLKEKIYLFMIDLSNSGSLVVI